MKSAKPKLVRSRLRVRIPMLFEAEGEGVAPVVCVAVLSLIFLGLFYLVVHR